MPIGNDKRDTAMEEWRLCQSAVGQAESIIFTRQGWYTAAAGAMLATLFTDAPPIKGWAFAVIGMMITVAFYVIELAQRGPHRRAIVRARTIEQFLRSETDTNYDGPLLSESLSGTLPGAEGWRQFWKYPRVFWPYACGAIILVVAPVVRWLTT